MSENQINSKEKSNNDLSKEFKNHDLSDSAISNVASEFLKEFRKSRRWTIFFRFFTIIVLLFIFSTLSFKISDNSINKSHTALIDIEGSITSKSYKGSIDSILPALNQAFSNKNSVGVILRMNSPGGSPVQSAIVNNEIIRLKKNFPKKPIYVVVEDMCLSGCYYIAAAADKIYVSKSSIIGSIGVLMSSFGFVGLMDKLFP